MRTSRLFVAAAFIVLIGTAFPSRADTRQTTDRTGSSHVMPRNDQPAPGRQPRLRGWIGVGVNTAILIVKIAIPSIAHHPLAGT
jgi:hypothetical protein